MERLAMQYLDYWKDKENRKPMIVRGPSGRGNLAYEDFNAFKLYAVDVGLLAAMGNISAKTLLKGSVIFEEFKGALTEQYVLQQLKTIREMAIYYWSSKKSSGEVDFVLQYNGNIYPVEVKAEENVQAKSLKSFKQKYPNTKAIRTSMSDYRDDAWLTNLPLFAIQSLTALSI